MLGKSKDVEKWRTVQGRNPKIAMVYCWSLNGHRQIYCDVLTDFLLSHGYSVVLAVGGFQSANGIQEHQSGYIEQYKDISRVVILPLKEMIPDCRGEAVWHFIRGLQSEYGVSLTLFADGDGLRSIASGIRSLLYKPKLLGRNCAIFLRVGFIYHPIRLGNSLGNLRGLGRRLKSLLDENLFFRVILRRWWDLDVCFFADCNFVRAFDYPEFRYFPEIHRSFKSRGAERSDQYRDLRDHYQGFMEAHSGKDVILYFGNAERRKGYDYLVKLVHDHADLVFVHCGRHVTSETYDYDVSALADDLRRFGRMFELLDTFITDSRLVDDFFLSTKYVLLPYRNHYTSSGILIQAAAYGKPVLVPSVGQMNSLVTSEAIGLTYTHLSYMDFERQFIKLKQDHSLYLDSVLRFAGQFTEQAIHAKLREGLGFSDTESDKVDDCLRA